MSGIIIATYSPGDPETLWHYAPVPAFQGIIESRTLWASDTLCMSDPTEFSYPREVLVRVLERMEAISDSSYERWILAIAKIIAEAESGPTVYAACTSEVGDLWSQWDVFADGGTGFAIGLNRRVLHASAAQQGYSVYPMIYDVSEQEAHYQTQFRDAVDAIPAVEEDLGRGSQLALLLGVAFSYPLTVVKNHQYVTEGEWRLMRMNAHLEEAPEPMVRNPDVCYEEVALDDATTGECSITEVVAGPNATSESIDEARRLLDRCGFSHVRVQRSTTYA